MVNLAVRQFWYSRYWAHTWLEVEGSQDGYLKEVASQTYVDWG